MNKLMLLVFGAVPMALLADSGGAPQEEQFRYDAYESWNAFPEGAWVKFEVELSGRDNKCGKEVHRDAVAEKRGDGSIQIEEMREAYGETIRSKRVLAKNDAREPTKGRCCNRPHPKKVEWTKERIEVAGRTLETCVLEVNDPGCRASEGMVEKTWFSKEVPGWIARWERRSLKSDCKTYKRCLGFGK